MAQTLKLKIQEHSVWLPFKGKLYIGTPSRNKPRNVTAEDWCTGLIDLVHKSWKNNFAIPFSFWPEGTRPFGNQYGLLEFNKYFHIVDNLGAIGLNQPETSMFEIYSIIECLMRGQDVLVLSSSKKISGFLPVVLRCLVEPQGHIVKIMYSTEGTLTADQRGYIAGLVDARHLIGSSILRDIEKTAGGLDYHYDDEKSSLEPKNIGLLEQQLLYLRSCLDEIGRELFYEITLELKALADFLTECEEHPSVDITLGSFASIGYRLCDVYKETSTLGYDAIKTFQELDQSVLSKSHPEQLAMTQAKLINIADRLVHICNNKMCFLTCDLEVLRGHPEVAEARELSDTLKLINEQLSKIQECMEQIAAEARQFSEMKNSDFKPAIPKEDKDWHATRIILKQCVQQAIEAAQAKIRGGGATDLPPKAG